MKKKKLPSYIILLMLLAFSVFSGGLTHLKNKSAQSNDTQVTELASKKAKKNAAAKKDVPQKPQEAVPVQNAPQNTNPAPKNVEQPKPEAIQQPAAKPQPQREKTTIAPKARWHQYNLQQHWEKHGAEFPEYHSAQEYGDAALELFSNPPEGTLTKTRPNGDKLYYHPPSNTFGATAPDGTPKTMFRPSARMNYWNRQ